MFLVWNLSIQKFAINVGGEGEGAYPHGSSWGEPPAHRS